MHRSRITQIPTRLFTAGVLLLAFVLLSAFPLAAQDTGNGDEPEKEEQEQTEEQSEDTAEEGAQEDPAEGDETSEGDEADEGPDPRIKVIRSSEEELEHKKGIAKDDPFLDDDVNLDAGADEGIYNPRDWISFDVEPGTAFYIVQDAEGKVLGSFAEKIELNSDPAHGEQYYVSRIFGYEPKREQRIWINKDGFAPHKVLERSLEEMSGQRIADIDETVNNIDDKQQPLGDLTGAGEADDGPDEGIVGFQVSGPRMRVDYLYDSVEVRSSEGAFTRNRSFRQYPYSFGHSQLALLVRMLDYRSGDWPFEAAVTDPRQAVNMPMQIGKPRLTQVLSAEPETRQCFEVPMKLGNDEWTWWIERLPPYRVIKFTDGNLVYTLENYLESE